MDVLTIITGILAAIGGVSGLVALFTLKETKQGKQLENDGHKQEMELRLVNELQDQVEKLNERLDKKDARIMELEDSNASLRGQLDTVNTALAKATLLRCTRLQCESRRPPLGYSELTPEELTLERGKVEE